MQQVLFTIPVFGGVKVFGYGLMLFLAFLASMHLAAWRARREKLDPEVVYDLALWVFIGGLFGARFFYVAQYWGTRIHSVWEFFAIWKGGIVLYGSIMGGAAAFFLYWAFRRFPLRPMMDVLAPALVLGVALGRFGCFLNGCCFGDPCELPWAVSFPQGSPPWVAHVERGWLPHGSPSSLPVHPTQLYSILDSLIILALLSAYYPLRRRDGEVLGLLMITYPITRFLIERLRNDEAAIVAGLTIAQTISLGLLAGGVLYWLYLLRLPEGRYADTADPPAASPRSRHADVVQNPA